WAKLRVSKNFDLFLLKRLKYLIHYINYFTNINNACLKVRSLHLRVNNIRDVDRLTLLDGLLEAIWSSSQTIALITARQLPGFNANFNVLITRFVSIVQRGGEGGIRAAASSKILILQDLLNLLLNAADEIGNNVLAIFFDISNGQLQPLVAHLDQFL
ncbi:hypothetical protein Mgra_00006201, partial [Meloidogyne graminicola]